MVKEKKEESGEQRDVFKTWSEGYSGISKIWEETYVNFYKPWIESTGTMFEKAVELSKGAAPKEYKEFYDEWMKAYQQTFDKFVPVPPLKSNKETLEKFVVCAEESGKLYRLWIGELEENSRITQEMLQGEHDPAKYKECYDMWMKSYDKMFDELLSLPAMEGTKEMFGKYTGVPDIYLKSYTQMLKLWKKTYTTLYGPLIESTLKLSEKMMQISRGEAGPEAYKEFYDLWMATYRENFAKYFQFMQPSKEVFENFAQNTNVYLNMYKSWMAAFEKMSEKARELSKQPADPEASKEFYNLWIKMYEKAFDGFFESMPMIGPMKEMMTPVKNAARIYADSFINMYRMWMGKSIRA